MIITRHDLEVSLERLRARARDPRHGIHGPGTMAWELGRESLIFLGGGAATLLQLAHPYVAHGVDQHSRTRTDMLGRFQRTFRHVFAMTFGDLDQAFRSARAVHGIHTRVTGHITEGVGAFGRGHRYHANDAEALLWVFATLVFTSVQVIELAIRPLGAGERERYYQDSRRFAALFGIPESIMPADWPALTRYMDAMLASDVIQVGEAARALCGFLMTPPRPVLVPLWPWYTIMTSGLVPARLRRAYGLSFTDREAAIFAASLRLSRLVHKVLPAPLRHAPGYVQAERRAAGLGPSRLAALMESLALGKAGKKAR